MAFTVTLGKNFKLYVGTATPTVVGDLVGLVRDVTIDTQRDESSIDCRESGQFKDFLTGNMEGSISFDMIYDSANVQFGVIQTAYFANTKLYWKAIDATHGFSGSCWVQKITRNEPLNEGATASITLRITGTITVI